MPKAINLTRLRKPKPPSMRLAEWPWDYERLPSDTIMDRWRYRVRKSKRKKETR